MSFRWLVLCVASAWCAAGAQASPIAVTFVRAEVPPNSTTTPLPYFLSPATDIIFLKFKISNIADVVAIDEFIVNVTVYDDGDGGGETGLIEFALPGSNILLGGFNRLNGTTAVFPVTLTTSLCPCQIGDLYPDLTDGTFRIRVSRETGDFFLAGATASINGTLSPEPAALMTAGGALWALAGLRRARRRK